MPKGRAGVARGRTGHDTTSAANAPRPSPKVMRLRRKRRAGEASLQPSAKATKEAPKQTSATHSRNDAAPRPESFELRDAAGAALPWPEPRADPVEPWRSSGYAFQSFCGCGRGGLFAAGPAPVAGPGTAALSAKRTRRQAPLKPIRRDAIDVEDSLPQSRSIRCCYLQGSSRRTPRNLYWRE